MDTVQFMEIGIIVWKMVIHRSAISRPQKIFGAATTAAAAAGPAGWIIGGAVVGAGSVGAGVATVAWTRDGAKAEDGSEDDADESSDTGSPHPAQSPAPRPSPTRQAWKHL